jgi:hypothetical protein
VVLGHAKAAAVVALVDRVAGALWETSKVNDASPLPSEVVVRAGNVTAAVSTTLTIGGSPPASGEALLSRRSSSTPKAHRHLPTASRAGVQNGSIGLRATGANVPDRAPKCAIYRHDVPESPEAYELSNVVETALAKALVLAAEASRWDDECRLVGRDTRMIRVRTPPREQGRTILGER